MTAQSEQARARQAYLAGREQRDRSTVQMGKDNARIDGNNASGRNPGGAR